MGTGPSFLMLLRSRRAPVTADPVPVTLIPFPSGPAPLTYDLNAALKSLQQHDRGIHVVGVWCR